MLLLNNMGNKNDKYTKAELKQIAKTIPTYPQCNQKGEPLNVKRALHANTINASEELTKLAKDNKLEIKPGVTYSIPGNYVVVDHLKRMNKYLKKYGEEGIKFYIDNVKKEYALYQVWVQANSNKAIESTPIQSLSEEEVNAMNQREYENPHSTSNTEEDESITT